MQNFREKKSKLLLSNVKSSYCKKVKVLSNYLSIPADLSIKADEYKNQYLYTENNISTML